jgi:hypothetical protein
MKSSKSNPPRSSEQVIPAAGAGWRAALMVGVLLALLLGSVGWLFWPQTSHTVVPVELAAR